MTKTLCTCVVVLIAACTADLESGDPVKTNTQGSGSGATGSGSGSSTGQTSDNLLEYRSMARDTGSYYEGVVCDYENEGVAWCDDDFTVVWCSDEVWWSFDCSNIGAWCDTYDFIVDCYY